MCIGDSSSGGQVQQQEEVFTNIFIALGVAIALMYLILVVQFGSFLDPIAILISLPLSLIGVMSALAITGSTINLMSLIGVILLLGIVAKNAILLVVFAKESRALAVQSFRRGRRGHHSKGEEGQRDPEREKQLAESLPADDQ